MSKEIIEKATSLADAVTQSEVLLDLRSAEQKMNNNPEACKLIEEFQNVQMRMAQLQESGHVLTEVDKKTMEIMDERMESNEIISAYMDAQDRFTDMLDTINSILSSAISGNKDNCSCCSSSACETESCGCSEC